MNEAAYSNHADARALLLDGQHGILSTLSVEMKGHPFGSVVPYCLDRSGAPVLLISDIAQHTRNIVADERVALTVVERAGEDVQSGGRLTLMAAARRIEDSLHDAAQRYYRHFPQSRDYHRTHGFAFFRLQPLRWRFIGGFGNIRWIEPAAFVVENPFSTEQETEILAHMNDDHAAAMRVYLRRFCSIETSDQEPVEMVGIDGEGFDLRSGRGLHRLRFEEPASTPEEARSRLVAMARQATTATP